MLSLRAVARRARDRAVAPLISEIRERPPRPDAATQVLLREWYRRAACSGQPLPTLRDAGFQVYSQADEDGILLYIFSLIGAGTRRCVEICAGDGIESNTANLVINHGWTALLVDGDESLVATGRRFYANHPATAVYPPVYVCAWVTRENVNGLIREHGVAGEIDLLSIDVDGMDYWLWDTIEAVDPRVVVVEYQDILGPDRAWTVPYQADFDARDYPMTDGMPEFAGASLAAFVKLGRRKGYRLVGCNRYGYNAFFVRNPLADRFLPEIPAAACFNHPKTIAGMRDRFPRVKDLPWLEV